MPSTIINITQLMNAAGIAHSGKIKISHSEMSGLEPNPKDDWLYLGLLALKDVAGRKGAGIRSAAFIGSGNGIETIAALKLFPQLKRVYITDLVKDVQTGILQNINDNASSELEGVQTHCLEGRDCHPLPEKVDLIYGNLPLIMFSREEIERHALSRTTLTDADAYLPLAGGKDDPLLRYSLLSQLGFLRSAKEKLAHEGVILTFIGGRVPYQAIEVCFNRAGLQYKKLFCAFKKMSDPQFLEHYAHYEKSQPIEFAFYDYAHACRILRKTFGIHAPEIIPDQDDDQLKQLLQPARINAQEAYTYYQQGKPFGHIAYAFEAWN